MPNFKTVTIGDSVAWGQGLREEHKFHVLAAQQIARELGPGMAPVNKLLAHSGAVVDGSTKAPLDDSVAHWQEVPNDTPTILEQAHRSRPDVDVRLAIAVGGINDVDFRNIIDPIDIDDKALERLVRMKCYTEMKRVIRQLRARYPSATVVVAGYYPIVSEASDIRVLRFTTSLFAYLAGAAGFLVSAALAARAVRRVWRFHLVQLAALRKAVTESHADSRVRGPGVLFAHPAFGPNHSIGAPEALLWSPETPANLSEVWERFLRDPIAIITNLDPSDEMVRERRSACVLFKDDGALVQCNIASLGHPNVQGAKRYGRVIAERYLGNQHVSIGRMTRRLDGTRSSISARSALVRYGLAEAGDDVSIQSALQHARVDAIEVLVRTRDESFAGTDHNVFFSVGGGRSWELGEGLATADLIDDFERDAQSLYVIDPAAGKLSDPLYLWDIREIALELRFNVAAVELDGAWAPEWIRVLVNGRSLHRSAVERPLRVSPLDREDKWTAPDFPAQ